MKQCVGTELMDMRWGVLFWVVSWEKSLSQGEGWHVSEVIHEESWAAKNWCIQIVVLEKTLESPLDCKEIKSVYPKGDQSWVFIGRTDAEAETPILWPPDAKSWLIGKDYDAGERLLLNDKTRDSWLPEETNSIRGQRQGWIAQSFCVIKFY